MTVFAWAAISAALLTGPIAPAELEDRSSRFVQVAQAAVDAQPAPTNRAATSDERIAAFWIILPD